MKQITPKNVNSVLNGIKTTEREPRTKPAPTARDRKSRTHATDHAPRPSRKRVRITLEDMRLKPVETQYFIMEPQLSTVLEGPFTDLDEAITKLIQNRRDGQPCRLIAATTDVLVPERWTDTELEADACDYR